MRHTIRRTFALLLGCALALGVARPARAYDVDPFETLPDDQFVTLMQQKTTGDSPQQAAIDGARCNAYNLRMFAIMRQYPDYRRHRVLTAAMHKGWVVAYPRCADAAMSFSGVAQYDVDMATWFLFKSGPVPASLAAKFLRVGLDSGVRNGDYVSVGRACNLLVQNPQVANVPHCSPELLATVQAYLDRELDRHAARARHMSATAEQDQNFYYQQQRERIDRGP